MNFYNYFDKGHIYNHKLVHFMDKYAENLKRLYIV